MVAKSNVGQEVFPSSGFIIEVADHKEMLEIAINLYGQLTCTLYFEDEDITSGYDIGHIHS